MYYNNENIFFLFNTQKCDFLKITIINQYMRNLNNLILKT